MRSRRPSPEHEQAVARRLAALSAQWDAARVEAPEPAAPTPVTVPSVSSAPHTLTAGEAAPAPDDWPWEPHTRVRDAVVVPLWEAPAPAPEPEAPGPAESEPVVAAAPVPGRHAARRSAPPSLGGRVRDDLPWTRFVDQVGLRATHLVWVALFAVVVLAATSWWLVRAKETTVLTPVSAPVAATAAAPTDPDAGENGSAAVGPGQVSAGRMGSAEAGAQAVTEVVVDVAGKVRRPGLVVLPAGARVADAIEAAGGARKGVDLQPLNLARVLVDGEQIIVGAPAADGVVGTPTAPDGAAPAGAVGPGGLVNLNAATQTDLEALPGIGPVTAAAILEWRTRHGGFTSVEDLLEVSGIGEVTLERLAPLVTV